jgi:DNA (cytosine-5)-methyltransferase 1
MKFIDLFAGLGGFHTALEKLGHQCVFASELKDGLASIYEKNFGMKPHGDIRKIKSRDIPAHDILCAGFPCQPFSKAGMQKGLEDETNGNLFNQIVRILRYHTPSYFILENVQNLAKHANEETYSLMSNILRGIGYEVEGRVLSPHQYNIPQHRQRLFIVGSRAGLKNFKWPVERPLLTNSYSFLETDPNDCIDLEKDKQHSLDVWQEFLDRLPKDVKLPSFPIWAMEFGATYPYENQTPFSSSSQSLSRTNGSFGVSLNGLSRDEKFQNLPSYARAEQDLFPSWKRSFIRDNRAFYDENKRHLKGVVKKIRDLGVQSWQKFEWNVQGGERNIKNYIIQFRGSGIRLKRADFFPSLVCVSTQIPIVGWESRYITRWEGARLQGMETLKHLPENIGSCFDALGNAVNAEIVFLIAQQLLPGNKSKLYRNVASVEIQNPQRHEAFA